MQSEEELASIQLCVEEKVGYVRKGRDTINPNHVLWEGPEAHNQRRARSDTPGFD